MAPPARACWYVSSVAGTSLLKTTEIACPLTSVTPRVCQWAAISRTGPDGKAPSFLVAALKDPMSGNLDRIQIVKGWLDKRGKRQEKVYDVVWSGDRQPDANGKLPPVGNTVDVANATWTNTIGAPELIGVWTDPDFDPAVSGRPTTHASSRFRRRAGRPTKPNISALT